jgi:hypothetical protein
MARRGDLLVEVNTTLDGSGNYTGDWIDSSGIERIRVLSTTASVFPQIQQTADQVYIFQDTLASGSEEYAITGRYFRLAMVSGTANATYRAIVRAVSP